MHANKTRHSSSVVTRTGALTTPYATRGSLAGRSSDYPGSVRRSLVNSSLYSPLTDPHLRRYFQSKLVNSLDNSRPWSRQGTPTRPAQPRVQMLKSYKVTVRTGQSGTSAKVYVTLHGNKGRVLRQRLSKGGRKEWTFQAGSVDVFRVRGADIGTLKTITVENEGLKESDGWFLESVSVANQDGEKWTCPFNQWLSLHHTDCQLTRCTKARPYTPKPPQRVSYTLSVHTGDVRGAGTGANVFITLTGTKGTSPKTQLPGTFDRGSVIQHTLELIDVGPLKSVSVEHDGSGFGPDWFLDYLTLEYKDTTVYCQCAQWLSRTEGDGLTHRTLSVTSQPPQPYVGKSYIVTIRTGTMRGAGTDANVFLTLIGSHGNSDERRLDNAPANFERGRTDTFCLSCSDIGEVTKVKLRHDNTGFHPGWYCESVNVSCEASDVCFPCGQWLELCDGCGGDLQVELMPSSQITEIKVKAPRCQYMVTMETGSLPGASTTANVYVELHGCHGNSGRLWLSGSGRSFTSGGVDVFSVECASDVGDMECVLVGHDNSGPSPGWFLKQVTVKNESSSSSVWVCPCDRWLCMDSGDGRIERELHPLINEESKSGRGTWTVHVWTSDIRGAGTDANVTIQVHGSHGDSSVIPLGDGVANFEQGEHDVFCDVPVCENVGRVESVSVAHDGSRPYPDWHVARVMLFNEGTGDKYMCECNRWLKANKDGTGSKVKLTAVLEEREATPTDQTTPLDASPEATPTNQTTPLDASPAREERSLTSQYVSQLRGEQSSTVHTIPYTVHVSSGAPPACDPAPFLVITLIGHDNNSQPIRLQRLDSGGFVLGTPDTFSIECDDIGHISSVKVVLDAPSDCPTWLIEQINIDNPTSGHTHQFPCGRGLSPGNEVMLNEVSTIGSSLCALTHNTASQELTGYEVKVYTSDKKAAGIKNNLHLILTGTQGHSKPLTIKNRSMFQRGQIDTFQIATNPIGPLMSIQVAHSPREGRGNEGAWHLFQVILRELASNTCTTFPCRQWIKQSATETLNYVTLNKTDK